MRVVMYSPWPCRSFADHAAEYTAGANNRKHKPVNQGKVYSVVVHAPGCLNTLSAGDRLYIMGHGVELGSQILADSDVEGRKNTGTRAIHRS